MVIKNDDLKLIYGELRRFAVEKVRKLWDARAQNINASLPKIRVEDGKACYYHTCSCGKETKVFDGCQTTALDNIVVRVNFNAFDNDLKEGYYICPHCGQKNAACKKEKLFLRIDDPENLLYFGSYNKKNYVAMAKRQKINVSLDELNNRAYFYFYNRFYLLFEDGDLALIYDGVRANRPTGVKEYNLEGIKFSEDEKLKISEWIGEAGELINKKYELKKASDSKIDTDKVYLSAEEFFTDYLSDKKTKKALNDAIKAFESGKVQIEKFNADCVGSSREVSQSGISWEHFLTPRGEELYIGYRGAFSDKNGGTFDSFQRKVVLKPDLFSLRQKNDFMNHALFGCNYPYEVKDFGYFLDFSFMIPLKDIKRDTYFSKMSDNKIRELFGNKTSPDRKVLYFLGTSYWEQIWSCFSEEDAAHYMNLMVDLIMKNGTVPKFSSPEYQDAIINGGENNSHRDVRFISGLSPKNLRRVFKIMDKNKERFSNYKPQIECFFSGLNMRTKDLIMSQSDEVIEKIIPICNNDMDLALQHVSPQKFVEIYQDMTVRQRVTNQSLISEYFRQMEKVGITINKKNRAPLSLKFNLSIVEEIGRLQPDELEFLRKPEYLNKSFSYNDLEIVPIEDPLSFCRECFSCGISGATMIKRSKKEQTELFCLRKGGRMLEIVEMKDGEVLTSMRNREFFKSPEIKECLERFEHFYNC